MIKQWELFERSHTSRVAKTMRVSLNERGGFALNQKVFEELKQPKTVQLFFDKINKLIGIHACEPEDEHAYDVKQQGKSKSYLIRAMSFCSNYSIKVTGTMVFVEPTIEDGYLVLDLMKAAPVPERKPKQSPPETATSNPVLAFGSTGS